MQKYAAAALVGASAVIAAPHPGSIVQSVAPAGYTTTSTAITLSSSVSTGFESSVPGNSYSSQPSGVTWSGSGTAHSTGVSSSATESSPGSYPTGNGHGGGWGHGGGSWGHGGGSWGHGGGSWGPGGGSWPPSGSGSGSDSGPQVPFKFPLPNGFPNIKNPSAALTKIELQAHGTLPNAPLSKTLQPGDETIFELIAFNELFEVAFFTSLLNNITSGVSGYEISSSAAKNIVVNALTAVQAQEELHALGANGILAAAGQTTIQPCEYVFPTNSFDDAINLARTFTDVVLGTLQDAQAGLAKNGDDEYIPLIGSVIGQEGEQNGFYRTQLGIDTNQNLVPSELPFLTRSAAQFAFSVLNQAFVVPGSCPNSNIIDLPIFGALTVVTPAPIQPKDQEIEFSFDTKLLNGTSVNDLSVVYINQQNLPVVEAFSIVGHSGDFINVKAELPYSKFIMNGLTIAAITNSAGPFQNISEVVDATLFGPGLIEIN